MQPRFAARGVHRGATLNDTLDLRRVRPGRLSSTGAAQGGGSGGRPDETTAAPGEAP